MFGIQNAREKSFLKTLNQQCLVFWVIKYGFQSNVMSKTQTKEKLKVSYTNIFLRSDIRHEISCLGVVHLE